MTVVDRENTGELVDLRVSTDRAAELRARAICWPSWTLTARQLCDLELLACGGFSPLRTFLGELDYLSVCDTSRLVDGTLWPMPITLDLPARTIRQAHPHNMVCLRDPEGDLLAVLEIAEAWRPNLKAEAAQVLGTTDEVHPGVEHLLHRTQSWYVSGRLEVVKLPEHRHFRDLRRTPAQLREQFARAGWDRIVAFQTRNPMHHAHQQLTLRAARAAGANLLIHPVVGVGRPGDIDPAIRVRCYRALLPDYPPGTAMLSILPLAMRMAGPREALWHAIIRRNYGATHFIVGRDHASPGIDSRGQPFYGRYAGQELAARHEDEVGLEILPFHRMVYVPDTGSYCAEEEVTEGVRTQTLSGTELRRRLAAGRSVPSWFTPPAVATELRRAFPPRAERGFTVFFTGLSGAGKSTIAEALYARLREQYRRQVTVLDGDLVRHHLSSGLGFSRRDRDRNVERIGFVAAEITRHRGIALCAPIAPYDRARQEVRRMVEAVGGFVMVYVATSLEVCEQRDRKGLYARARAGKLANFTGISDSYDAPSNAEVVIDTAHCGVEEAVERIIARLCADGYLPTDDQPGDIRYAARG